MESESVERRMQPAVEAASGGTRFGRRDFNRGNPAAGQDSSVAALGDQGAPPRTSHSSRTVRFEFVGCSAEPSL